jgi:hypothetical protein
MAHLAIESKPWRMSARNSRSEAAELEGLGFRFGTNTRNRRGKWPHLGLNGRQPDALESVQHRAFRLARWAPILAIPAAGLALA